MLKYQERIVFMSRLASFPESQSINDDSEIGSLTLSKPINSASSLGKKYRSKKRYSFEANHLEFDDEI